jgi:hypothetical protein
MACSWADADYDRGRYGFLGSATSPGVVSDDRHLNRWGCFARLLGVVR